MKNLLFIGIIGALVFILFFPIIIFISFEASFYLFLFSVFPTLFLMLICSEIIIQYRLADNFLPIIEVLTKPFKINGYASLIFFLSIFTGTPGNAKLIGTAYQNKQINSYQAEQLLCITSFFNPLLVISTIGFKFFGNQTIGLMLFASLFLVNLIIARFFKEVKYIGRTNFTKPPIFNEIIISSLKTMAIIFSVIFMSAILLNGLKMFIDNYYLLSIIEFVNGMFTLSDNYTIKKIILALILINQESFSIILQSISIIKGYDIKISKYLIIKAILSIMFVIVALFV